MGGEYTSKSQAEYLDKSRIVQQFAGPDAHHQVGKAERQGNRTTQEMVSAIMNEANAPPGFWAEALNCAVFVWNNMAWKEDSKGFYSRQNFIRGEDSSQLFNEDRFRVFGCRAWRYIPIVKRKGHKSHLRVKAEPRIFLGYDPAGGRCYRLWNQKTRKVETVAYEHVVTDESNLPWRDKSNWAPWERSKPRSWIVPSLGIVTKEDIKKYGLPKELEGTQMNNSPLDDDDDDSDDGFEQVDAEDEQVRTGS